MILLTIIKVIETHIPDINILTIFLQMPCWPVSLSQLIIKWDKMKTVHPIAVEIEKDRTS